MSNATKTAEKPTSAVAELRRLIDRARKGDVSTMPEIQRLLREPANVDRLGGDLARRAELSFVNALAGDDLLFREALVRKLAALRDELAGPNPTPIERLLVERAVACWLQVQDADVRYAQAQLSATMKQGDYQQQRMDRAHRRYLLALRTLAQVRKLAVPVLQVNIGKKQVNIGRVAIPSPGPGTEPARIEDGT